MLHFNELRYSKDNKYLLIDAAVDSLDYYDNVFIGSIVIDNQDTFVANGPSSSPIYTYSSDNNKKQVRLELPINALNINCHSDILFIYVIATGTPAANTPCGFDNSKIMGTVINLQDAYNSMLSYIREVEKDCTIPKEFIDTILRFKAIEIGIKTGNYPLVIKYWKKYFSKIKNTSVTKNCGCYG